MRVILRFLALLIPVIGLCIYGSLKLIEWQEREWLSKDLGRRAELISSSIHEYVGENLLAGKPIPVARLLNKISKDERLLGILVCSPEGKVIAKSESIPDTYVCPNLGIQKDHAENSFIQSPTGLLHQAIIPVADDNPLLGSLVILHDTRYMAKRHETTRAYVIGLLAGLSVLYFLLSLLIYRWSMSDTMKTVGKAVKDLLKGDLKAVDRKIIRGDLSPIARDLSKVMRELRQAKQTMKDSENALSWTPARLRSEVQRMFGDAQLCVIANREPYVHNKKAGKIEVLFPASGLVTAVEPIVRACSGLWIAHGSGSGDRETSDQNGKLLVPPGSPEYALKRVWMNKKEEQGYYYGFSNEGLWPLCHIAHARPHFDSEDWKQYRIVNERFAQKFDEEKWEGKPVVLIQDYHFALLPKLIREKRPESVLSLFWHIPWPNPEAFGICPWKKELLEGMLGADLIGFHTQFHCNNFLDTVDRYLEARVDREHFSVTIQGHTCYVKPFAISVEWPSRFLIPQENLEADKQALLLELGIPKGTKIGVGVDRVDYTKGLLERLRSVEKFLDENPEWVGKFTFVQISAPSRTHIKRYQDLNSELQELADEINWKFSNSEVPPITLRLAHHNAPEVHRFYQAADFCFVSSLHDGMNLVAKEFIAAREDNQGVLILSTFAGASRELTEALLVNPYDLEECALAIRRAMEMGVVEQAERMRRLRKLVSERNVYAWAGAFLSEIHRISERTSN